ncbi:MAG TPA: tRNA preQ1(34) S-adenosylmethionine ribosyltransferase-isomerase QueA [Candidatus Obscuribacterales bacterium]
MSSDKTTQQAECQNLSLEDFAYDLPPELIAQHPCEKRDQSRLLVIERTTRSRHHMSFGDIVDFFEPGDVLVANNTRVIPARLYARRLSGGVVKFLLIKPETKRSGLWEAMVTPIKRLKAGEVLVVQSGNGKEHKIEVVEMIVATDGFKRVLVDLGPGERVFSLLSEVGFAPLPPYILREHAKTLEKEGEESSFKSDEEHRPTDLDRYQTVFATEPGAVAAPTAGLHFSKSLLSRIEDKGVHLHFVTLHVGPGTFKPIATTIEDHTIEPERYSIGQAAADAVNRAKQEGKRVFAVGTTTLRALETSGASGIVASEEDATTSLYVKPGHSFKIVDCLVTNFHLSKSSLLVLVCAFAGRDLIMAAYKEAIAQRYRFFSYGDAMLIV